MPRRHSTSSMPRSKRGCKSARRRRLCYYGKRTTA
jgi:hypothetical protein